jgi:molecular chaperone DnaK (HSP70)
MNNTDMYEKIYAMLEKGCTPEQIVEGLNKAEHDYKKEQEKKSKQNQTKVECARKILINSIDNYVRAITDMPISDSNKKDMERTFEHLEKMIKADGLLPLEILGW